MTVYVDDAVIQWRGQRWAHLMADGLEELHAMAAQLGLPRRAFQDKPSGAHYDVTVAMREHALRLGAVAISRHRDRELRARRDPPGQGAGHARRVVAMLRPAVPTGGRKQPGPPYKGTPAGLRSSAAPPAPRV